MEPIVKTRFPVSHLVRDEQVFPIVATWISGNRHFLRSFNSTQVLDEIVKNPSFSLVGSSGSSIQKETLQDGDLRYSIFSFKHQGSEPSEVLETKLAFRNDSVNRDSAVSVVLEYGCPSCFHKSIEPRKPVLVNMLIDGLPRHFDSWIPIKTEVHLLQEGDEFFLADLLSGNNSGNFLPVIYVSRDNHTDETLVDSNLLAKRVAGFAHVVAEPNHSFSNGVKRNLKSEDMACYNGAVRIYWPRVNDPRLNILWTNETLRRVKDPVLAISSYLATKTRALTLDDCSYDNVVTIARKKLINNILGEKQQEAEANKQLIGLYDQEIATLEGDRTNLRTQVSRLTDELTTLREDYTVAQMNLRDAQAFKKPEVAHPAADNGEVLLVLDALVKKQGNNLSPYVSGRIKGLLELRKEELEQVRQEREEAVTELSHAFNDYRRLTAPQITVLRKHGFDYTEEGKHYKIIRKGFNPDIFVTCSKTPSDIHAGKNFVKDLVKVFYSC